MKTLILVRHAEAAPAGPEHNDRERPLTARGGRAARHLAEELARGGFHPETLVCSPALRARSTAEALGSAFALVPLDDDRLYEGDADGLLAAVRGLDDRVRSAVVVGHHPAVSRLLRRLTEEPYADLPAGGSAVTAFPVKSWKHVCDGQGRLQASCLPDGGALGLSGTEPVRHWKERFTLWRFQKAQRLEIWIAVVAALLLLLVLVPLAMHMGRNEAALPKQGGAVRYAD